MYGVPTCGTLKGNRRNMWKFAARKYRCASRSLHSLTISLVLDALGNAIKPDFFHLRRRSMIRNLKRARVHRNFRALISFAFLLCARHVSCQKKKKNIIHESTKISAYYTRNDTCQTYLYQSDFPNYNILHASFFITYESIQLYEKTQEVLLKNTFHDMCL